MGVIAIELTTSQPVKNRSLEITSLKNRGENQSEKTKAD